MDANSVQINPYRRIMSSAVSAAIAYAGFRSVTRSAIETLTEIAVSFMTELGRSGKVASELAGRTFPMANDVIYSLVELGIPVRELPKFHKEITDPVFGKRRITISNPGVLSVPNPPQMLHIDGPTAPAKKRRIRSNIPDFYPDFPDPHTYIWTPTYKQPITDYITVREKAANQKRDVEKALCRFVAKTGSTVSLIVDIDEHQIPVPAISVESTPQPYLRALLFKDQYFNEEVDDGSEPAAPSAKSGSGSADASANDGGDTDKDGESEDGKQSAALSCSIDIDNPFLRSPVLPVKVSR